MSQIRNASDTTCKQLLRDGERFADLCNALYFHGRQVIKPENLISQENDVSTLIGKEPLPMETKRYRDIVRKASINGEYMIIGVEHQSTLDKNMIIRILNYDAQLYINQVESGKEVRPVGSFVFYTGDKEWTYPKSLKESLKIPPGTNSGKEFIIQGKGLPYPGNINKRGNFIVKIEIDIPDASKLNKEAKKLIEELNKNI